MDISIVVPVYNVGLYLKNCLDSIIEQDFKGTYEIICINDGSTDNSLEILNTYEIGNDKIILINQKNKGLSNARNVGISNSKGKYIMFIDSDDYLKSSKVLNILYDEVEKYNLDFVVADFEYDYEDKRKNHRMKCSEIIKSKVISGREFYDQGIKTRTMMSMVWNKLYRREFFTHNNIRFLEGIIYEDFEFTPRIYYLAERVKYIDEVVYMYRQRKDSISSGNNTDKLGDFLLIADSLNDFNENYSSITLHNYALFMYVLIVRKLKYLDDKNEVKRFRDMLKDRQATREFLKSNRIKYKVYGLLYHLIIYKLLITKKISKINI